MAVVNGAALLVLALKEEQLDLKQGKGDDNSVADDDVGLHLVGEVVDLGDQPRSALHLPARVSIDALIVI